MKMKVEQSLSKYGYNIKTAKKLLIIINIVTLCIFLYSYYDYRSRKKIIASGNYIENYEILKYYCWGGTRGGSTVDVRYNSKIYSVGISYTSCEDLKDKKGDIKFYYNKDIDIIFTPGLNFGIVIFCGFWFILTMLPWFLPKKYW